MRIVLAPDSFKGSATALEVCQAMKDGIQRACSDAEIIMAPVTEWLWSMRKSTFAGWLRKRRKMLAFDTHA